MTPSWDVVVQLARQQVETLRVSLDSCDDLKTLYRTQGRIQTWKQLLGLPARLDVEKETTNG